ncbi:MAG: amidohydrolase family protein [Oscillospiraceae bacterium]
MIVDNNMHWMPEGLFDDEDLLNEVLRIPPQSENLYAYLGKIPGTDDPQVIIEQPKGYQNLNYTDLDVNFEKRVAMMDEIGVDMGVLRIPCLEEWMTLDECRKMNDRMHKTVEKYPGRFAPLAMCPPWGDKDSIKELERCVKELGCVGVEMAAHYGDKHMDEPEFRTHLRKIHELGVPIVVHHTPLPAAYDFIYQKDKTRRLLGRCFAQLTCITRNIFSDLFEELPELKIVHSYFAGGFFAFTDMMNIRPSGKYKEEMQRVREPKMGRRFEEILKNNLYFDMCHASPWGKDTMEFAIKALGADHVLYGSSCPIKKEWAYEGPNFIRSLNIPEEDKALVLGDNAARLFKLSK